MKRGPYRRNQRLQYYEVARSLRREGFGYETIAKKLRGTVSSDTIRNWVVDIESDRRRACRLASQENGHTASRSVALKLRGSVRRFLIRTRGYRCQDCGLSEWRGKKLPLEVEHINGIRTDNRDENVKLNCPNCHSITSTWRGRNRHRRPLLQRQRGRV